MAVPVCPLVFGGEGFDLPRDVNKEMADNPYFSYTNNSEEYTDFEDGQGYLEPARPEKDMIQLAKKTSTKTVVVINAANVFQLGELQDDPEINANVSGVFAEEDPFNKDTQTQPSFVNYNDSIYVGYHWYETAAAEGRHRLRKCGRLPLRLRPVALQKRYGRAHARGSGELELHRARFPRRPGVRGLPGCPWCNRFRYDLQGVILLKLFRL